MKIYKYKISTITDLPAGCTILKVGLQEGVLYVWALVDLNEKKSEETEFIVLATGEDWPLGNCTYLDTVFKDRFVWHVFVKNKPIKIA